MKSLSAFIFITLIAVCFNAAAATDDTFVPNNPELTPIRSHHTPAYQAAKLFQHGANLGNYLEEGGHWGVKISADEFAQMKRQGFDHIRIPIGWQHYVGPAPDFIISPEFFARVDFAVTNVLMNKMAAIINIHHFDELDTNPVGATPEFLAIWQQIAQHYKDYPEQLAFELDNEPHAAATTAVMNPIYVQAIVVIRGSNPKRTLFVEPGGWGSIGELKNLTLPPDDNIIVSVHCYDPFRFTHQGASWVTDNKQTGIIFPGPPPQPLVPDAKLNQKSWELDWIKKYNTLPTEKNPSSPLAFTGKLHYIHEWSDYYGRPIHLGEFGAYTKADEQSRANFYSTFRRAAEKENVGWCIWDWSAGFRYWDKANNAPMPGMHDALFGK